MFRFLLILVACQVALAGKYSYSAAKERASPNDLSSLSKYKLGARRDNLEKHRLPMGVSAGVRPISLPDQFDARDKWQQCPSLREIRNQGCCGSCWAISAASVMSDRWCIHNEEHPQFSFGAYDLLGCCKVMHDEECGDGCEGGFLGPAWAFWVTYGLSSGGPFKSRKGCHSYPAPEVCARNMQDYTPQCATECQSSYNVSNVYDDVRYGRMAYSMPQDEERIMEEIYTNGPVQASFDVYMDFKAYEGGVYRHRYGFPEGGHAVKLLGWGVEDNTKYWLAANSWGRAWGDKGFFKIVRGENHVGIESDVHAGIPHYTMHKGRKF